MLFGVRDKEFDITFVNNYCREQYQDMLAIIDDMTDLPAAVEEVSDDQTLSKAERLRKLREMNRGQRAMVRQIATIRLDIVRELVETNGYEFDERWWSRKTDADDMNEFALGCLQKDIKSEAGSKKK